MNDDELFENYFDEYNTTDSKPSSGSLKFDAELDDGLFDIISHDNAHKAFTEMGDSCEKYYGMFGFLADQPIFCVEEITPEPVAETRKEEETPAAHRSEPLLAPRTTGAAYNFVYYIGLQSQRHLKRLFRKLTGKALRPFKFLLAFIGVFAVVINRFFVKSVKNITSEYAKLRREIRLSTSGLQRQVAANPKKIFSIIKKYIYKAVERHPHFFKVIFNTALPVAALALFITTVGYWNNVTYALEVTYNDQSIGYISGESVFIEAEELVKEKKGEAVATASEEEAGARSVESAVSETSVKPTYSVKLVNLAQLNDANTICDRIIENSGGNLTYACGVYINKNGENRLVCAVKNENDARNAFDSLLEQSDPDKENMYTAFVEDVTFVQGLYPDDSSTIIDATQLLAKIRTENLVSIKTIETRVVSEDVDYDTDEVKDSSIFKGDRRVISKGVYGEDSVTYQITYINGEQFGSSKEISRVRVSEPVNERVRVGTKSKTVYGISGSYSVKTTNSRFIWPTSGCYTISSGYGYRSRGWHSGVDISGGGASGKPILAADSGTVELVNYSNSGYGNQIVINHGGGYKTRYAHCLRGSISVSTGQRVSQGQAIARVGSTGNSTGPHLHFEIIVNGSTVNPLNYIGS